ncbi:MAG: esterase/lipase family protein [Solirubrobacteraceae bacterium]
MSSRASHGPGWWGRPVAETRWLLEACRLSVDPLFLRPRGLPRGDGRPVVLVPGFLAGDQTLAMLAVWLRRLGYRPTTVGFVTNTDCSDRALDRVVRTARRASDRHGRRVAVIGHSRGGHFARALAASHPEVVSHAVSLGADLNGMLGISVPTQAAVTGARLALHATGRTRRAGCFTLFCDCPFATAFRAPIAPGVRMTSVYSRGDGVVDWPGCLVDGATNIEVTGSHVGLVFNRKVFRALSETLAQPELSPSTTGAEPG